jgi:hypothetical protein
MMLEALWRVGLTSAYQSAYQCARALVVGEESIHRDRPAGLNVASGGGCLQVEEWVLPGLSRQREQGVAHRVGVHETR